MKPPVQELCRPLLAGSHRPLLAQDNCRCSRLVPLLASRSCCSHRHRTTAARSLELLLATRSLSALQSWLDGARTRVMMLLQDGGFMSTPGRWFSMSLQDAFASIGVLDRSNFLFKW
ncbi:hypothetical protein Dimus_007462 [Dionaea muscipula]